MAQQPVENYGVVGDMHTVALVGKDGSIDFMCFPRFDSPTIFAALLDPEQAGAFPARPGVRRRPPGPALPAGHCHPAHALPLRGGRRRGLRLHARRRSPARPRWCAGSRRSAARSRSACVCAPRFDYGRARHRIERRSEREWVFASEGADRVAFLLRSDVPLSLVDGDAVASFRLGAGQSASFILEEATPGQPAVSAAPDYVADKLQATPATSGGAGSLARPIEGAGGRSSIARS